MKLLHKPLGIALTASFCAFWGLLLLPTGYVTSMATGVRGAPHHAGLYGFLCMLWGGAMLASAYGLWRMQTWGRPLAIAVVSVTLPIIALGFIGMLFGGKASAGAAVASMLGFGLAAVAVRYLGRDDVRRMYEGCQRP